MGVFFAKVCEEFADVLGGDLGFWVEVLDIVSVVIVFCVAHCGCSVVGDSVEYEGHECVVLVFKDCF